MAKRKAKSKSAKKAATATLCSACGYKAPGIVCEGCGYDPRVEKKEKAAKLFNAG